MSIINLLSPTYKFTFHCLFCKNEAGSLNNLLLLTGIRLSFATGRCWEKHCRGREFSFLVQVRSVHRLLRSTGSFPSPASFSRSSPSHADGVPCSSSWGSFPLPCVYNVQGQHYLGTGKPLRWVSWCRRCTASPVP